MSREFMKDFYNNYYEDPVYCATESDVLYQQERKKHMAMVDELAEILGGYESLAWKKYEACMAQHYYMDGIMAQDLYLMGASDRDKMLSRG